MNPDDPNYVAPTMEAAPDEAVPEESTTEETLDQALKMAVCAILDDEELSVEEKRDKIVKLLTAHEEVTKEDGEDDEPKEEPAGESKDEKKDDQASLQDRLTKLEQKLKAHDALESARNALEAAGFRPSKVEVKAFSVLESTAERDEFIATLKKANAAAPGGAHPDRAKPKSVPANSLESTKSGAANGGAKLNTPKTQEELAELASRLVRL